jgi:adenylate cyclase
LGFAVLEVTLYHPSQHVQTPLGGGSFTLGGASGLAIAGESNAAIDATLESVEQEHGSGVQITNRGQSLVLPGGPRILPGMSRKLSLPAQFWVGRTIVYVQPADATQPHDAALMPFPRMDDDPFTFTGVMKKLGGAPSSHTLAYWFDALGRLQRSPAGSPEFFSAAAYAVFDPGGLDVGMVLLRDGNHWRIAGSYVSHPDPAMTFRATVLERMVEQRHTVFHDARHIAEAVEEPCNGFVVAAPIFNEQREILGAVYGARFDHHNNQRRGIRPLEAQFVQAVADTVSAGLSRTRRESEVIRLRTRLEQVFSPTVAQELERNPQLLDGDQREVTVLFCDLRGFTSLAERLAPRESYALLGDVMDRLTHEIARFEGVVIDYFGDGLAAFWNAPLAQSDHPYLACQAAFALCDALPEVSGDWMTVTGRQLQLGIGIHTGQALVGNAGSRQRIKYGPRGSTVNLASRVQTATKQVRLPILVTQATSQRLAGKMATRRIARIKLDGFEESVDLFQPLSSEQQIACASYSDVLAEALASFEQGDHHRARECVALLRRRGVNDSAVDYLARQLRTLDSLSV